MRQLIVAVTVALLLLPVGLEAQGTLVVQQNKCALDKQAQIRQLVDSLWLPVAQELVNDGKLLAAGSAYHAWGDEWNVVYWYTASDVNAFHTAYAELFRRASQRNPTLISSFLAWCSEHKDNIYNMGKSTASVPAGTRRP